MCEKDDFMLNSPQSNYIFKIKKKMQSLLVSLTIDFQHLILIVCFRLNLITVRFPRELAHK